MPVTNSVRDVSLRNALGIILEGANLRCTLDGETLVIEHRP
jgi:hypothetical protein